MGWEGARSHHVGFLRTVSAQEQEINLLGKNPRLTESPKLLHRDGALELLPPAGCVPAGPWGAQHLSSLASSAVKWSQQL